ncbi:MAG: hypothetical protein E6Q97_14335 [Desulfurellales bacterium]|nr:MAG: hypothetical protein E6Q97_14335 [Desulfurellales bacterium]
MGNETPVLALPAPTYTDLRFDDGTHSGVRIDLRRGILEVQKRGVKHVFDLTTIQRDQHRGAGGGTDGKDNRSQYSPRSAT